MDASTVKAAVMSVVLGIHKKLNPKDNDIPEVSGATCPGSDLNKFDSKIWPVATSRIAKKLDITIPDEEKLFGDTSGKLFTIDQVTEHVCSLIRKYEKKKRSEESG